jgi:hypothetical protein
MNRQGAQVNHVTDSSYQTLSAVLELGRGKWHEYPSIAFRRGISYMNFNRRALKEVDRSRGFLQHKREGRRSFIRNAPHLAGTNGDIKRDYRLARGWE